MYHLAHFLSLSHKIFISCYRPNRGEGSQHQPHNCQVDGTQPHGVVGLYRSVVCSAAPCQEAWTSPITWTHRACHRPLGSVQPLLQRPDLQSNSKVAGHQQAPSVSGRRHGTWTWWVLIVFKNLSVGNSLTIFGCIFLKVFVCIFLKVFVCIFLKVFVCMFLKVFIWTMMKLLKLVNYDELIEFCELWTSWTMNYELLWTQTVIWWTAVRDPKCCVCILLCVRGMNVWRQ